MLPPRLSAERFVIVWMTSASAESAAKSLAMPLPRAIYIARWMAREGVHLKAMPLTTPGKVSTLPAKKDETLTPRQWMFAARFYDLAYRHARHIAEQKHGAYGRRAPDVVEAAALDSLLAVARRSTDRDFHDATAVGLLKTVINRKVRDELLKFYGEHGSKRVNSAVPGVEHFAVTGREDEPWQVLADAEEAPAVSAADEQARRTLGPVSDEVSEHAALKAKAVELDLSPGNRSTAQLRDLVALHVREMLARVTPRKGRGTSRRRRHRTGCARLRVS